LAGKIFSVEKKPVFCRDNLFRRKCALLKVAWYLVKNKSWRENVCLGKKGLRFWMESDFLSKNILSLLAGKICAVCIWICLIKRKTMLWLAISPLFKSAEIFFFSATLHSQKIVKEIAYISPSYQAPLKARNFFILDVNNKRKKTIYCLL